MAAAPPLCGLPSVAAAWGRGTGRRVERALTLQVLQHMPQGSTPRDTVSVVVLALALFREELRKHLCFLDTFSFEAAPLPSPTERSHASASAC